ncbi:LEA_3 domain-containing protein [Cephalotus follicularis]|uniref:LEA_3 domain-containing protein n=1 Tax=Cephalotus follicularis TaxID=3775 RepID=A0A1Q3BV62_CEPFO|nr:LEA_3 domain-containing protein [Cephalotus follicularis]
MATAAIVKTKILMLSSCRQVKKVDRCFHKPAGVRVCGKPRETVNQSKTKDSTSWIPDPRTGIYFPKGHEWVLKDVPASAASFNETYWLRNVDGVEKSDT